MVCSSHSSPRNSPSVPDACRMFIAAVSDSDGPNVTVSRSCGIRSASADVSSTSGNGANMSNTPITYCRAASAGSQLPLLR